MTPENKAEMKRLVALVRRLDDTISTHLERIAALLAPEIEGSAEDVAPDVVHDWACDFLNDRDLTVDALLHELAQRNTGNVKLWWNRDDASQGFGGTFDGVGTVSSDADPGL